MLGSERGEEDGEKEHEFTKLLVQEYVEMLSDLYPELVDILVDPSATIADEEDKRQGINFPEYITSIQVNEGLKVVLLSFSPLFSFLLSFFSPPFHSPFSHRQENYIKERSGWHEADSARYVKMIIILFFLFFSFFVFHLFLFSLLGGETFCFLINLFLRHTWAPPLSNMTSLYKALRILIVWLTEVSFMIILSFISSN